MATNPTKWEPDEIQQELLDNADFYETNSVAKAKKFVSAAARWLIVKPQQATGENRTIVLNTAQIMKLRDQAAIFIESSNNSSVKYLGVENYRG